MHILHVSYYIPSLSIKQPRALSKTHKRRWGISKNENLTTTTIKLLFYVTR